MSPIGVCLNKRKCADCGQYKSTVRGATHNPAHGSRLFVCKECTEKRKAS